MRVALKTCLLCLALSAISLAQTNPFSAFTRDTYAKAKDILLHSAEKMPEENYNFRPTDSVRTYGQLIGHLADAQYLFCSIALGEKNPNKQIEQTKTSKVDLIASIQDSFTYCDKAYASMTDASGAQIIKLFGSDTPRLDVLTTNNLHDMEHYGNLVTYLRLKNIVPRTSEPEVAKRFPWE